MALQPFLSEQQIRARITELGASINSDYPDGILYLLCILKGATIFHADLARAIQRDTYLEFMGISSYGQEKTSSGQVQLTKDLDISIEGAHVLIVEDIVDSGITLSYLTRVLRQRNPKSLAVAALLDKPTRRLRSVEVKYVGFSIPDEFVVGYGMDFNQRYRNLPGICVLTDEAEVKSVAQVGIQST